MTLRLVGDVERMSSGRWRAQLQSCPGAMSTASTRHRAIARVRSMVLRLCPDMPLSFRWRGALLP